MIYVLIGSVIGSVCLGVTVYSVVWARLHDRNLRAHHEKMEAMYREHHERMEAIYRKYSR